MTDNPYAPPKSDVGTGEKDGRRAKPGAAARFLWTAIIAFPLFFGCVLLAPSTDRMLGALGSALFAVFSGLIALCIPVRLKVLFIAPSIVVCMVIAYIIGSR